MALRAYPTIPSDLKPKQALESDTGILHVSSPDAPSLTLQYWITTRSTLPTFTQDLQEAGYGILYLTPFLVKVAWARFYPDQPVLNTISVRHTETALPNFHSLDSLMSILPTPATPPSHNPLTNPTIDPTAALILLTQQTLHKNSTMMVHMHARPYPPLAIQPLPSQPYKPHSRFTDGTDAVRLFSVRIDAVMG